jgi:hypothetical protein
LVVARSVAHLSGSVESGPAATQASRVDNHAMRHITAIGVAALAVLVAACAAQTTTSTPAAAPATAGADAPSSAPVAPASAASSGADPTDQGSPSEPPSPATFRLTSPAFAGGAAIPVKFSCDGAGISPEIAWSGAPAGTQAYALTVVDPDASGFVHWIVYDIPVAAGSLPENVGTASTAPPQGKNGRGARGYTGPCPPSGTHHYVFSLFALDAPLGLSGTPDLAQLQTAIRDHTLGMAVLKGTYKRS